MIVYLGNTDLVYEHKIGFFCASKVSSRAILPCYDWVTSLPRESVVISGFQSPIEKDVLQLLLKQGHRVMIVLARAFYKNLPEAWHTALDQEQMLIASVAPLACRVERKAAQLRNDYIARLADHLVFGNINEESSLWPCYQTYQHKAELLWG